MNRKHLLVPLFLISMLAGTGCIHVKTDPIEVKPIHITADITIRIDQKLDNFFAFEDKFAPVGNGPATAPSVTQ